MANIADLITLRFDEMKIAMLVSEVVPVYVYENGKRTNKIEGYKATFLLPEGVGLANHIDIKIDTDVEPKWVLTKHYEIEYDQEKSKVWVKDNGRNGQLALSLWAKKVKELK